MGVFGVMWRWGNWLRILSFVRWNVWLSVCLSCGLGICITSSPASLGISVFPQLDYTKANFLQRQNPPSEGGPLRSSSMDTTPEPSHGENHWHPVRVVLSNDENQGCDWNCGSGYREQHEPGRRRSNDEFGSARCRRRRRNEFEIENKRMFANLQDLEEQVGARDFAP